MADGYSIRLACPLCHHISAALINGSGLTCECAICHAKFELDPVATRAAIDLLERQAVMVAPETQHCESCGSALFRATVRDG